MQNRSMICGYARVSPAPQDLAPYVAHPKAAGCEKISREKNTGMIVDRPQLRKLIIVLSQGDVVIAPAVDRFSLDTTDVPVIVRDMQHARVGVRSLAEPFLRYHVRLHGDPFRHPRRSGEAGAPPHSGAQGTGPYDSKVNGVEFRRKPGLSPHQQREVRAPITGETRRSIARSYNVSQATISRLTG